MPKVIQVIEYDEKRGTGAPDDPYRMVKAYCTLEGEHLAYGSDGFYEECRRAYLARPAVTTVT